MRSFLGIPTLPLTAVQGIPAGQPLQLGGNSSYPPTVVPLRIDWSLYATLIGGSPVNLGVTFNLLTGATRPSIDILNSVYIDNTASAVPVYVRFPSTGMTISAAPNTADWYPCITQDLQVQVFVEGLTANNIPVTGIWFTNILMQAYSDAELNTAIDLNLASASISRGSTIYNTNFGIPALGDQTDIRAGMITTGTTGAWVAGANMFGSPYTDGFIYLTHAFVWAQPEGTIADLFDAQLEVSGGIQIFPWIFPGNTSTPTIVQSAQKMNLKLDATLTYRIRLIATPAAYFLSAAFIYTTNPN